MNITGVFRFYDNELREGSPHYSLCELKRLEDGELYWVEEYMSTNFNHVLSIIDSPESHPFFGDRIDFTRNYIWVRNIFPFEEKDLENAVPLDTIRGVP